MSGSIKAASKFVEQLPASCPPAEAVAVNYETIWRYVNSNPPIESDFQSHAMRNKNPPPGVDPCRWASCSLFLIDNVNNLAYKALPKVKKKYKFLAQLKVTHLCGVTLSNGRHVDFWRFSGVIPNVTRVIAL